MNRKAMFGLFSAAIILCSSQALAAPFGTATVAKGVIEKVNYQAKTIVITNDRTGRKETYKFDDATRIVFENKAGNENSNLQPGQIVQYKVLKNTVAQGNSR